MKAYLFLFFAILFEAAGTSALNMSQQFTRFWPTVGMIAAYVLSFYLMTHAIKTIPLSITYAIWSAVGIILIMTIGAVVFKQVPDIAAIIGAALIITGVLVIHLFSKMSVH